MCQMNTFIKKHDNIDLPGHQTGRVKNGNDLGLRFLFYYVG
jgi:hypothetical protein